MDISIIIPVLNEQNKIAHDVESAANFLVNSNLSGEIIVVDDGSSDNTSKVAEKSVIPNPILLKVIRYDQHRGKGYAVRTGILDSSGEYVMFMDSGGNVPLSYITTGIELIKKGSCDIAMGSRKLPESKIHKNLIWYRRISSFLFRKTARFYLKIPDHLTDTQCGFKLYKGNIARNLYNQSVSEGFVFDLEIILDAQKSGYQMLEFPIEWTCDRDTRLSVNTTPKVIKELRKLKKLTS